jgi:NADH-quinone oxidoreductase subunit D
MEFYERISGARMHAAFYRPNEINLKSISSHLLEDIQTFTNGCMITLNEINSLLLNNNI